MAKVWDNAIQCYVDDGECHCICHERPGVMHCFPCCDKLPKTTQCYHDLEWVGQRGPEVLIWKCRRCGEEIS